MNELSIKGHDVLTKDEHLFAEELKKRKAEFNPDVDLGPDPDENAKPLTFDDEIEEDSNELVSFSDVKNNKQETWLFDFETAKHN